MSNAGLGYNAIDHANILRAHQYRIEQEILHKMGLPFYTEYQPPPQARTNMKEWVANLQCDFDHNQRRIEQLVKIDTLVPTPKQDTELMTTELHLRRALNEVLKQRMNTEAAKNK